MSKYKEINVSITLDTTDPLYARLESEAQERGTTVESLVNMLIGVGSHVLLDERLKRWKELHN